MAERDPTLKEPRRSEGRAACSNCSRVLIFSGEPPRFCGYCGSPLSPDSAIDSANVAALPEATSEADAEAATAIPTTEETVDYVSRGRRANPDEGIFPARVADFRLGRRLGAGGMGTVFEAFDEQQGRNVAVKLIALRSLDSDQALDRFRLEGRTAAAVTHPRCVFVHAVDEDAGLPYIVMELMPGDTLQSHVEANGPLPPSRAIPKILDVMEGLAEFHRLGMIHRDVKPSNCFLDDGGRVKIGDFGLSKSMEGGADLTRSGAFLGTPLYASPEQIKREPLDERTDVYSVAATLYFLLTGRPPVLAREAAEALARIVSEPAPPIRDSAPGVPRTLEAVVLKGLERDRSRRWRNLREFHDALLPFLPERVDYGSIGLRVGAYLIDLTIYHVAMWAALAVSFLEHRGKVLETLAFNERHGRAIELLALGGWIGYFVILEGLLASSAGKWLVGLRVARTEVGEPPGMRRALARTLVFVLLAGLGTVVWHGLAPSGSRVTEMLIPPARLAAVNLAGLLVLAAPMRQRTGFRGLHDWASGTRVVRVVPARGVHRLAGLGGPRAARRPTRGDEARAGTPIAAERVGPYEVDESIVATDDRRVVAGHDSALGRRAWLILRAPGAEPPDPRRCALDRLTRPRWIGGGDLPDRRWDAFTAPTGRPLREAAGRDGLPWRDVLPILIQLAEELEAARGDGTSPETLSVDDVWIQDDGRVQIVDPLDWGRIGSDDRSPATEIDEARALALLGEVARAALGGDRPARRGWLARWSGGERRGRRAVPLRAGEMLDRLTGRRAPYARLAHLRADLITAASRPTEVGVGRRGLQLAIQALLMAPTLLILAGFSYPDFAPDLIPRDAEVMAAIPVVWLIWAFLARGGVGYPLAGLCLVGRDGRAAGRVACAFRAFLAWSIPVGLLLASEWVQDHAPAAVATSWSLWLAGILAFAASVAIALILPVRGPHDVLAGTTVVPA